MQRSRTPATICATRREADRGSGKCQRPNRSLDRVGVEFDEAIVDEHGSTGQDTAGYRARRSGRHPARMQKSSCANSTDERGHDDEYGDVD